MNVMRFVRNPFCIVLTIVCFALVHTATAQPMSAQLQEALKQRDESAISYHMMRDTMTANTWTNLMTLIHHLQRIASADSVIQVEYADLFTSELRSGEVLKMKIDSLSKRNINGPIQSANSDFPFLYIALITIAGALALLGIYLFWLLRKRRTVADVPHINDDSELLKINQEYETKLAEISQVLSELTTEREKTILEIDELTKTYQREHQQRVTYSDHYEKLSGEYNQLKMNLETLMKENVRLKATLETAPPLVPENESFVSEIEALHQQLAKSNGEKSELMEALSLAHASLAASSDDNSEVKQELASNSGAAVLSLEKERTHLIDELNQAHVKIKTLNDSLADSRLLVGQTEALRDTLKRQVQAAVTENERLKIELDELQNRQLQEEAQSQKTEELREQLILVTEKLHLSELACQSATEELRRSKEEVAKTTMVREEDQQKMTDLVRENIVLNSKISEIEADLLKKGRLEEELKKLLSGI